MANWTIEQLAAIKLRGADILVSAAAGSGKTAVLVERITQMLIRNEADVDRLLIVTYTNAAAGEMRSRIEDALSDAIEMTPENGKQLSAQIKLLNRASIKTFHAFCLDVIRSHFLKVDLDPNFKMIRESERLILMEEALEDVLETAYEVQDPSFEVLVESYTENRDDQKLRKMIKQLYGFSMSQAYPEKWLEVQSEVYGDPDHPLRKQWEEELLASFREKIEGGLDLIDRAIELCQSPGGPQPYLKTMAEDRLVFERLSQACDIGLEALERTVSDTKLGRIASIKKSEKENYDQVLIDEVKELIRNKLLKKQILEKIQNVFTYKSMNRYQTELFELSDRVAYLIHLVIQFSQRFAHLKKNKNLLDFNDLEHYTVKILEDETVCKLYREKFNHIFVDEYQDASSIQETIISRIARKNNRFMVGDVKQSIYKFRLADPALFLEKYKSFDQFDFYLKELGQAQAIETLNQKYQNSEEPHRIRIDLKNNFRTRTEILGRVNDIFETVMSEKLGDVAYDHSAKLHGLMAFEETNPPYVEMNLISKKPMDWEEGFEDAVSELKADELEARAIATKIKTTIGTPVYFPKEGVTRPCTYKDIVILLRSSRSWIPTFEEVFMEEGIPFYADSQSGYFDALEIKLIVDILKIIDNPFQDLSLLTVLRSPIVGLSLEGLVALKLTDKKAGFYYDRLLQMAASEEIDKAGLKTFIEQLKQWREKARYLPLDELIWEVIKTSGFYTYVSAMPGGIARQANIKLLIDRARELKNSKLFTLSHFVDFIDQMEKTSGDMGVASSIGEEEDVVRLMSIHKSKGLEFPVVIIGGLGKKFNLMDTYGDMIPHKDLGIAFTHVQPTLRTKSKTFPQHVIKETLRRETLSEEMRVLYVGLTRPVDRLILFGTVNDYKSKEMLWRSKMDAFMLTNASTFLDWLMPVVLGQSAIDLNLMSEFGLMEDSYEVHMRDVARMQCLRKAVEEPMSLDPEVESRLSYVYPGIDSNFKPLKASVTDKKNKDVHRLPELVSIPEFMEKNKPLSGAEKGTVMHKILEKIDFKTTHDANSLSRFIESMRLLNQSELESVDPHKILSFLKSEMGIRLSKSIRIHKETPFVIMDDGQLVQGVIDLFFEEADGYVLIDYKTDFVGNQSLEQLSAQYAFQVSYYKRAIEKLTGKKVKETYLYFMDVNRFHLM